MNIYKVETTKDFQKTYAKLVKNSYGIEQKIIKSLKLLAINPFNPALKTHKADTRNYSVRFSSRVTGDLRIIWDFKDGKKIILALTIGGHSGGKKVYK